MKAIYNLVVYIITEILKGWAVVVPATNDTTCAGILQVCHEVDSNCAEGHALLKKGKEAINAANKAKVNNLSLDSTSTPDATVVATQ